VVGGGARSALWVRMVATLLGRPAALAPRAPIAACLGAARLASVAADLARADDLRRPMPDPAAVTAPDDALAEILAPRRARFAVLLPEQLPPG
jgi:xylulokinase